ncbi:hypothetical protein ACK2R4_004035, partial [Yersinia enterocolitica]
MRTFLLYKSSEAELPPLFLSTRLTAWGSILAFSFGRIKLFFHFQFDVEQYCYFFDHLSPSATNLLA